MDRFISLLTFIQYIRPKGKKKEKKKILSRCGDFIYRGLIRRLVEESTTVVARKYFVIRHLFHFIGQR